MTSPYTLQFSIVLFVHILPRKVTIGEKARLFRAFAEQPI